VSVRPFQGVAHVDDVQVSAGDEFSSLHGMDRLNHASTITNTRSQGKPFDPPPAACAQRERRSSAVSVIMEAPVARRESG
jgi:hypothetical protein